MFNSTRFFARIFSITKFKATSLSIRYKLNSSSIFSQFSKFLINSIKEVKIFPLTASFSFLKPSSNQRARSIQIIFQKRNQNRETRSNFTVNFNFNKDRKFVKIFQFQCKDSKTTKLTNKKYYLFQIYLIRIIRNVESIPLF